MMTQDDRWIKNYQEVKAFIEKNHRNPSKYEPTEKTMVNWLKQQRKLLNTGAFKQYRIEAFKELVALIEENKRVNQYM